MDESEAIEQFLAGNAGAFCDECLEASVEIPADEVKASVFAGSQVFARVMGRCRRCRRTLAVTALRRAA